MATITVSREAGSGGGLVARRLAQALGYHLADKELMRSVLGQYGLIQFEEVYDAGPGFLSRLASLRPEVTRMLTRVVSALARHGDTVILGRGASAVLRGFADVLNVRVQAPFPLRVRRVAEQRGISDPRDAEAFVVDQDRRRAAFVEFSYGIDWENVHTYDVVLDTGKLPHALVVSLLVQAGRAADQAGPGDRLATRELDDDAVLAEAVSDALRCRTPHVHAAGARAGAAEGLDR